jgi:ankyrin repeat protein
LGQIEACKYVDYILKHPTRRFDIDHRDHQEFTPLMSACRANNPPLIGALIDNGADTTVTDDNGRSILHLLIPEPVHDVENLNPSPDQIEAYQRILSTYTTYEQYHNDVYQKRSNSSN